MIYDMKMLCVLVRKDIHSDWIYWAIIFKKTCQISRQAINNEN
jgi:hypothetical protein